MDTQNEHKKSNARLGSSPQNDRRRLSNPQGCLITAISTTASALEEDKRPFVTDKSKETHAPESAPSNMYPLSGLDREAHGEETERREREREKQRVSRPVWSPSGCGVSQSQGGKLAAKGQAGQSVVPILRWRLLSGLERVEAAWGGLTLCLGPCRFGHGRAGVQLDLFSLGSVVVKGAGAGAGAGGAERRAADEARVSEELVMASLSPRRRRAQGQVR